MLNWLRKLLGIKPRAPYRVLEIRYKDGFRRVLVTGARGMHLMCDLPQTGLGQGFIMVSRGQAVDPRHFDELRRYYGGGLESAVWASDGAKFKGN